MAAVVGYGRRAYAACTSSGGSTYQCSGTVTTPQSITANNAAVSTAPGFNLDSAGDGIKVTGDGALSYTDLNASPVTATATALYVSSHGDYGGTGTPGSVTINTNGALTGYTGINARNYGSGAISIATTGDVTSTGGAGRAIEAYNSSRGTYLSITTGDHTTLGGGFYGIHAINQGTGPLTVTTGAGSSVSGTYYGMFAQNFGSGALTIIANGDVTGTYRIGIVAQNTAGTDLNVTTAAGTTVSGNVGINTQNYGSGATTIIANGDVTGTGGDGIYVFNSSAGTDLSVTTAAGTTISGADHGINAYNAGTGNLTIIANGDVTSSGEIGITARNTAYGYNVSVTTAAGTTVSGTNYGILAQNNGRGSLTVTANGNVSATGTYYSGIFASNSANGTSLSVTTGVGTTVSGGNGIYANNAGSGTLSVIANGDVTGTTYDGIHAINSGGGDLYVATGTGTTVSGDQRGIEARNTGASALTIIADGDVTATVDDGIFAYNSAAGTSLSVTTGTGTTVSGHNTGIYANNTGTGSLTIIANGDVAGTVGSGIAAYNSAAGTSLSLTTAAGTTVSGANTGIYAHNNGTGDLTITANGDVTATAGAGIYAHNNHTGLSVTVGSASTVSGVVGIRALNYGTGAVSVKAYGTVTGRVGFGIFAYNFRTGTTLSVTTGAGSSVSGSSGIYASTRGTGALTITTDGDVSGTTDDGIKARSGGSAIDITVDATSTVSSVGAFAVETKGAAATITVAGTLTGGTGGAIRFDQTTGFANRLELQTGAVITGTVLGGSGTDTLALSGSGTGSFNVGQLSSFEAGEMAGSGAWTLTGTNTQITTFSVGGGTLLVNGSLQNATFTVSAGALGGTGTVGNVSVSNGTFAPGSGTAGSSMTVNGTLGFTAASTYAVNIDPATASFANVSGAATLGGATVNATFANGGYIAKQYTILTAGSVSGTFGTLANTNLPSNFHDTLSYDATHAYLNLDLNFTTPAAGGLNGNQNNVANALIGYFNNTGGIPMAFATLNANNLTQASGQSGADVSQAGFAATGQFIGALFDGGLGDNGQGDATGEAQDGQANGYAATPSLSQEAKDAYAAVTPRDIKAPAFAARWGVWTAGYGGSGKVAGAASTGASDTTSRIYGTAVGANYNLSPDTLFGFGLGGAGFNFDVSNGLGTGRADVFQAGVYGRHFMGNAYIAGALAYGWQDVTTKRTLTIAGTDNLEAEFNAHTVSARVEGGYRVATRWLGVTPYGALQVTSFYLPSYAEHATAGSAQFALAYAAQTTTNLRTELGARFDKSFLTEGGLLTLRTRLAWVHDSNTDRTASATFQTLPGATFTVNGASPAADGALVSADAEIRWRNGWSIAGSVEGEFSDTTQSYTGKGTLSYAFN